MNKNEASLRDTHDSKAAIDVVIPILIRVLWLMYTHTQRIESTPTTWLNLISNFIVADKFRQSEKVKGRRIADG